MRNLIYLPLLLIAAWNNPAQAQWANPSNPTGLPRHLLKPAEVAVSVGENSREVAVTARTARRSLVQNLWYQCHALHFVQADVPLPVLSKLGYRAGAMPGGQVLPV
ncbi:MAG: hypothetical protein ACK5U7_07265 [Bacteroidota bacterium]|jgi:hypothetical protein